jgi:putative spermidine/putrescine transport system substrate-binding protein
MSLSRRAMLAATASLPFGLNAFAQSLNDAATAELYPGERALYEAAAREGMVVSNNTGPTWANWIALFRLFGARYPNVQMVYNDVGSGVAVNALARTRNRPQVDTIYYFGTNGIDAQRQGLLAGFKPINFDKLPADAKHPDGEWFTIHQLSIAFLVNKQLVRNPPKSWADLLKPDYRNSIVYLDPRTTGVGQVIVFGAANAHGGSAANIAPGLDWIERLHKSGNVLRVVGTTPYAQFVRGEIPIWVNYDNDGLRAKFLDGMGDNVEIISPAEGTTAAPYTISLVKNAPRPEAGKLWLNLIMSEAGQKLFAEGFVTPSVPGVQVPPEVQARLVRHDKVTLIALEQAFPRMGELQRGWARAALGQG